MADQLRGGFKDPAPLDLAAVIKVAEYLEIEQDPEDLLMRVKFIHATARGAENSDG